MDELELARGMDPRYDTFINGLGDLFGDQATIELRARRIVGDLAIALQGSLLLRYGHPAVAEAFAATRLGGDHGNVFGTMIAPASVREVRTWFPDPWHKARHHKRRLITVGFTELVARVLEPDGVWRIATDWEDYAEWIQDVLTTSPHLVGGPVDRFDGRVVTRFERKGLDAGRVIHDFESRLRQTQP